jgi:hypothetical protein
LASAFVSRCGAGKAGKTAQRGARNTGNTAASDSTNSFNSGYEVLRIGAFYGSLPTLF